MQRALGYVTKIKINCDAECLVTRNVPSFSATFLLQNISIIKSRKSRKKLMYNDIREQRENILIPAPEGTNVTCALYLRDCV